MSDPGIRHLRIGFNIGLDWTNCLFGFSWWKQDAQFLYNAFAICIGPLTFTFFWRHME